MSQKREKEETQLKVSETLSLCTPPPAVPVSPPPSQQSGTSDVHTSSTPDLPSGTDGQRSSSISDVSVERLDLICSVGEKKVEILNRKLKRPREANRCAGDDCRRKLGLMGFRCRCGDMFCSEHRYSDRHNCSYDYKAAGREAIARENPVVKAAKILKV